MAEATFVKLAHAVIWTATANFTVSVGSDKTTKAKHLPRREAPKKTVFWVGQA